MNIRVVLVDDHQIFREGLRSLLATEQDMKVVGEASTGVEALHVVASTDCDVVLMDISMPEMNGIEATRQLLAEYPNIKVLILSMEADRRFIVEVLGSGACGYVQKDTAFTELATAIRASFSGETYLGPRISELIIKDYIQRIPAELPLTYDCLTPREREMLKLVADGKNSKELAHEFGISIKTVEVHRHSIMKKLNLFSIAELTKYAIREGLTSIK